MSDKGAVEITAAKYQGVAVGLKTHTAAEMALHQCAMLHRASQFQSQRPDFAIAPPPSHTQNPGQPQIDHYFGLSFPGFDEEKFYRGFLRFSVDANFLRARQLFVTSESLQSIAE